jgi:anti-sigma-K factor RskA
MNVDDGDLRSRFRALPGGRPEPRRRSPWRLAEVVVAAVGALLLIGLGLWNLNLQVSIQNDQRALTYQRQISRALASGATVSTIAGVGTGARASAALIQPHRTAAASLIVMNLPATPAGRVYQVWLIGAGRPPVSAALFSYHGAAPQLVHLARSARGYTAAAVTVEPAPGGSKNSTGDRVLAGAIRL